MQIRAQNLVGLLVGVGDVAVDLFTKRERRSRRSQGERGRVGVTWLQLTLREVDAPPVDPWRSPSLKPAEPKAQTL